MGRRRPSGRRIDGNSFRPAETMRPRIKGDGLAASGAEQAPCNTQATARLIAFEIFNSDGARNKSNAYDERFSRSVAE